MNSNWMHWLTKRISHNPWIFVWLVACAAILYVAFGCESKVTFDGAKVTRQELAVIAHKVDADYKSARASLLAKIDALDANQQSKAELIELSEDELTRQDEQKAQLAEGVVSVIKQFAPASTATAMNVVLGTLFPAGVGALYLNGRRKDKVIKEKNGGGSGSPSPAPT